MTKTENAQTLFLVSVWMLPMAIQVSCIYCCQKLIFSSLVKLTSSKKQNLQISRNKIIKALLPLAILTMIGQAEANIATSELKFEAPSQSFWGPDSSPADFNRNGNLIGSSELGISYSLKASLGTVSGSFGGALNVNYDNFLTGSGLWNPTISFSGLNGKIESLLGARFDVLANFAIPNLVSIHTCIICTDDSLDPRSKFSPSLNKFESEPDSITVASPEVYHLGLGLGEVFAGFDLAFDQSLDFSALDINGEIIAKNNKSGETIDHHLGIDLVNNIAYFHPFVFGVGTWDISFENLTLGNSFSTRLGLSLDPFLGYRMGINYGNCGDPGSDADNGSGCWGDDKFVGHLGHAHTDFYHTPHPFRLDFSELSGPTLTVSVVPEPVTYVMLLAGLIVLGMEARGRRILNIDLVK